MSDRDRTGGDASVVVGIARPGPGGADGCVVEWASAVATARDAPLRLLHVAETGEVPEWLTELAGRFGGRPEVRPARRGGHGAAQDGTAPDGAASDDDVGSALVDAGADAGLVVVGSRGGRGGLLAGEIADRVASDAACPVAVVRDPGPGPVAGGRAPVVVGVAGACGDDAAVRLGADLAASWGAPLRLVHAWSDVITHPGRRLRRSGATREALGDRARAVVRAARVVAEERAPGVRVDVEVVEGTALRALLDAGVGARALVVGPYGHVPPVGMQLGSSSRALVGFAPCTVVVARTSGARPGGPGLAVVSG